MANKENVRKWIEALRSGEYAQTRENLRTNEGYCCLGVACELSRVGEWQEWGPQFVYRAGALTSSVYLPADVMTWLGVESFNPQVKTLSGPLKSLGNLNDDGASFAEIADLIEREYLSEATDG